MKGFLFAVVVSVICGYGCLWLAAQESPDTRPPRPSYRVVTGNMEYLVDSVDFQPKNVYFKTRSGKRVWVFGPCKVEEL